MSNMRSNWIIASPTERQSMETLDKCKEWAQKANIAFASTEEELENIAGGTKITAKVIEFPLTRSKIYALPGRPSSLRGFTGSLILDEFAFFEDQSEVWKAVFAVIVNPMRNIKRVIITSTPNGQGDMFHRLCKEAVDGTGKLRWSLHKTTIHEAARDWEASGRLGGRTAEEYVQEVRDAFDTPEAWPQEFECEFLDTNSAALTFAMITAAESSDATEHGFDPDAKGEFYGGFDFGGVKDPSVFWLFERLGDILVTRDVLSLKGLDTVQQLEAVRSRIALCRRVSIDYTGPGRGFGDLAVREYGEYIPDDKHRHWGKIERFTFSEPSKRALFTPFRRRFEGAVTIRIPHAEWIRQDLHGLQMVLRGNDYSYWAPRMSAGHSDGACAAALGCRAASFPKSAPVPPQPVRRVLGRRTLAGNFLQRFFT